MALVGRLFIALAGFVAASLAASAFLNLILIGLLGLAPGDLPAAMRGSLMVSVPFIAILIGWFAFTPALVAIAITELAGLRDWLSHAMAGGAVGVLAGAWLWQGDGPNDWFARNPMLVMVLIGCGLVGGIAYWLVAGRSAGEWRGSDRGPTAPGPSES